MAQIAAMSGLWLELHDRLMWTLQGLSRQAYLSTLSLCTMARRRTFVSCLLQGGLLCKIGPISETLSEFIESI